MRHLENRSMTGVMTAYALACWVTVAAAQVNPGDPSSSALGESPGASGAVSSGRAPAGSQAVIPVGPGPSYPRVPRGITHPPEPFGPRPSNLGIEPLSPLPEARLPFTGQLGTLSGEEPTGPPDGLTIDQAIDRVLRLNLELRAQEREISKARADVLTAGLRSNPLAYADSSLVPYGSFRGTSGGPTHLDSRFAPEPAPGRCAAQLRVARPGMTGPINRMPSEGTSTSRLARRYDLCRQNDPNTEPSTRTATSERITLTITVITISK
jgi:hypothetical protein